MCWIMFGQLLMHSCGRGWVGISLLYFHTVDLGAWRAGREWKTSKLQTLTLPPSPDSPPVNPEGLRVARREGGGGGA